VHLYDTAAIHIHTNNGFSIWSVVHGIRRHIFHTVERYVPAKQQGMLLALLLGDRGLIDEETAIAFRRAGITHILAVSGLHTGIVLLVLYVLLLRLPLRYRVPLIIIGLLGYALLTGLHPPVVRAGFIAAVYLLGLLLQRQSHPVNAIAIAAAGILLFDPQSLFTVSFQLSFLAALSIALFYSKIMAFFSRWEKLEQSSFLRGIAGLLAVSIAAQLGTTPVILGVFGGFSVVSVLTNLVAVPAAFLAVVSSCIGLILGAGWQPAAEVFIRAALVGTASLDYAGSLARYLPWSEIHFPAAPAWIWALYIAVIGYLGFGKSSLRRRALISVAAIIVASVTAGLISHLSEDDGDLEIAFLDVGQGDATLITTPSGAHILIDTGPNYMSSDAGRRVVLPYLHTRGINRLEALVLTHADADHIGGADAILSDVSVGCMYYSALWESSEATRAVDSIVSIKGIRTRRTHAGMNIAVDSLVRLYVLSPDSSTRNDDSDNNTSIVLLLQYGNTSALFMGDADAMIERRIAAMFGDFIDVDILKAGHHGSASSSGKEFVSLVSPDYSIISCGRNNRYRHPDTRVLKTMSNAKSQVLRTDVDGTIIMSSNGTDIQRLMWNK